MQNMQRNGINNYKDSKKKELQSENLTGKMILQISNNLEQFIYAVSHDLKTPLIPILGFSDLLKRKFSEELPEKAKKYIDRIQSNAKILEQYLEGLVHLSRIGRNSGIKSGDNKKETDRKSISVVDLIKESCAEYLGMAKKVGIHVKIEPEAEISVYSENSYLVKDLFKEIISNAIKFQYVPLDIPPDLKTELKGENSAEMSIIIEEISKGHPQYERLLDVVFNSKSAVQRENMKVIYRDPVHSYISNRDKTNKLKIICIKDNGTGISSNSWDFALRIFKTLDNPNSLYQKVFSGENKYFKDIFSIIPSPIGMGVPIIQKICRIASVSVLIESVCIDDDVKQQSFGKHGTRIYLIL
ncbi:MAG: histidine kinase dimerization/phospho-acceptor domain-containing protein [Promethearchaeota archaeon]